MASSTTGSSRGWLGGAVRVAAFSIVVAIACLATVEGILRLVDVGGGEAAVGRPTWMDAETYALIQRGRAARGPQEEYDMLDHWQWHPKLRWSMRPNLDILRTNLLLDPARSAAAWRLQTNSRGFRTAEFHGKKPDTPRVVVVGDSNSMGWLLDYEDTYARRLEKALAGLLRRPVEVINLGVGGYTTFGCRAVLEEVALDLEPDALVISCGANDDQRVARTDARYAETFAGVTGRLRRWAGALRLSAVLQGLGSTRAEPPRVRRTTLDEFEDNLSAMFEIADQRGLPAIFLQVCCCPPERLKTLFEVTDHHEIPVLSANDVLATFADPAVRARHARSFARVRSWYAEEDLHKDVRLALAFSDRCHLNPLGAEMVGEALAERLAPYLMPGSGRTP